MAIDTLPPAPVPGSTTFDADVLEYLTALSTVTPQMNAAILALNNNSTNAVSSSSLTVGTGNKSLTVTTGKSYIPGHSVRIASTANGAIWMEGDVTAYDSSTGAMVVAVARKQGDGTIGAWSISLSPASLNLDRKGTAVASASSPNIWAGDGNTVHLTGTTTVTSFAAAAQAGLRCKVVLDGAIKFINSANLVLPGGVDFQGAADDILNVYADTTTKFYVEITKASGRAVVSQMPSAPWKFLKVEIFTTLAVANVRAVDLVFVDANGNGFVLPTFSPTTSAVIDGSTVGVNGMDADRAMTGGQAWYLYAISSRDGTITGLIWAVSRTGPILPSGYTHWAYLASTVIKETAFTNVLGLSKFNNEVRLTEPVTVVDGAITSGAWTGLSFNGLIPTSVSQSFSRGAITARIAFGGTGVHLGLRQFNANNSSYLPSSFFSGAIGGTSQNFGVFPTARAKWISADVPVYTNDVGSGVQYYSDTTTGTICILGWRE